MLLVGCSFDRTPEDKKQAVEVNSKYNVGDCIRGDTEDKKKATWKIVGKGEHVYKFDAYNSKSRLSNDIKVLSISHMDSLNHVVLSDCLDEI